jgi:hypothetical protein
VVVQDLVEVVAVAVEVIENLQEQQMVLIQFPL